jgi:hypothetical protein
MWRGDGCNGISAELSPRERHASNVAALGLLFSIGARLAGQGSGGSIEIVPKRLHDTIGSNSGVCRILK